MDSKSLFVSSMNSLINTSNEGILLYGAGVNAARFIIQCKRKYENVNILCIADIDKTKQGGMLLGIPIIAPEKLLQYDTQTCVVVTPAKYCLAITEKLNKLGFNNLLYYNTWNPRVIYAAARRNKVIAEKREELDALLSENSEKISAVRQFLQHDKKSVYVFNAKIDSLYFGRNIPLESLHEDNHYFPGDIISLHEQEVFVDCGAYDGQTTLDFIRRVEDYRYIYVFEPDPLQFELTQMTLDYERIERFELYSMGVHKSEGEVSFMSKDVGASRIKEDGELVVSATSLDALLYDKPARPTFIKMDIEGAELDALTGAEKIIGRDRPKLAISVYHGNVHIWEVPYWIKTNYPDYEIYIRQHLNINETVCYAVRKGSAHAE